MQLYQKIKTIRRAKNWTQDEMAEKLQVSIQAYSKIERGITDIPFSRLEKIAEVMDVELLQLLGLDEKNVFNFTNSQYLNYNCGHVDAVSTNQTEYKHLLEKSQLTIEYLKIENNHLIQQVNDLRGIIEILKNKEM